MGHVFELEESDFAGYIEDGEVYRATVRNVRIKEGRFVDERTNEKPNRVEFVFKLISDDEHDGQDLWGDTSTKFNTHPNCVAEDTEIVPIGHLIAATRGCYQGRAVRLDTRKGDESLYITPRHPVLTARGWVPAGELVAGDRILRHGCADPQSVRADLDHHPACAEEIYEGLAQIESSMLIATAPGDFHGDGAWIEGPIEATGGGAGRYRVDVTVDRALVPDIDDTFDGAPVRRVHVSAAAGRPRYGGFVDVPGFVATDLLIDLYGAGSNRVELDVIERVTEQVFAGQVYNFHTTGNAYFAAGIAVHNCRLKTWAEAILGQRLPPHYRLDIDTLLDKECRVMVGKRDYEKDGQPKSANFISEVHPSRANVEALAAADLDPF